MLRATNVGWDPLANAAVVRRCEVGWPEGSSGGGPKETTRWAGTLANEKPSSEKALWIV